MSILHQYSEKPLHALEWAHMSVTVMYALNIEEHMKPIVFGDNK